MSKCKEKYILEPINTSIDSNYITTTKHSAIYNKI